jgi:hypothetical protein
MKRIVFLAAVAVSAAAFAQAPKPEPVKAEPIKAEPAKAEPAKKAAKPAAMAKKNSRRSEDARQCLERATNNEIIKCAEEYL